jgi:hypothetical protein
MALQATLTESTDTREMTAETSQLLELWAQLSSDDRHSIRSIARFLAEQDEVEEHPYTTEERDALGWAITVFVQASRVARDAERDAYKNDLSMESLLSVALDETEGLEAEHYRALRAMLVQALTAVTRHPRYIL